MCMWYRLSLKKLVQQQIYRHQQQS